MKKILVVFGTRPEAIKMCPLVIELKKREKIKCVVCLTGQHREMLRQVMDIFQIKEDYNLDIMTFKQSLSSITVNVMNKFDEILKIEKPDLVLVHGDTTTSLAAAVSSFYLKIPVGHVEAGLRTYDRYSPFPEEFNRQVVDLVSTIYFAPTEMSKRNLLREGKNSTNIYVTGNTVVDALKYTVDKEYSDKNLEWAKDSKMILLTSHRRENIGKPMECVFRAIRRVVEKNVNVKIIFPIHMNPHVREIANKILYDVERVRIIEPLDVFTFHNYMAKSFLILTDSGGIQEEAPSLGVPVLVLRNTTERPEGLAAGVLELVGTEEDMVYQSIVRLLMDKEKYRRMSNLANPYGDGNASSRIVDIIMTQEGED